MKKTLLGILTTILIASCSREPSNNYFMNHEGLEVQATHGNRVTVTDPSTDERIHYKAWINNESDEKNTHIHNIHFGYDPIQSERLSEVANIDSLESIYKKLVTDAWLVRDKKNFPLPPNISEERVKKVLQKDSYTAILEGKNEVDRVTIIGNQYEWGRIDRQSSHPNAFNTDWRTVLPDSAFDKMLEQYTHQKR